MLDLELPFDPESGNHPSAACACPSHADTLTLSKHGCWGISQLSSAPHIAARPALVGRELESVKLLHALDAVSRENAAMVITVSGAPGSGKTRLIEETLTVAGVAGFEGRIFFASALPGDERNALIARLIRARFGLEYGSDSFKRDCLMRRVAELFEDERVEDVCYFLGQLVGLSFEQTPLTRALSQAAFHAEMAAQTIVCEVFGADSVRAPLCLVVEDLQHIDADSLGTLLALSDDVRGGMLLLCSAQPEFFARHEHFADLGSATHEHIELGELDPSDVRALLHQIVGPCVLGGDALERCVVQTGVGNPGTLQELVRELWAFGALQVACDDSGGCVFDEQLMPDAASAPSLRNVEAHRLPQLSSLQGALLEAASVVGSVCWQGLWPALLRVANPRLASETDIATLTRALTELQAAGHLLCLPDTRIEGEPEFLFKAPEVREKLLAQVPPSRRKALHRVAADWLSAHELVVRQRSELCLLLAQHLKRSGSGYRAALAFLQAAAIARREDGALRAAGYLHQGLDALGEHDNRKRIDALHDYGAVLAELGQPAKAREAFAEMLRLAERLELPSKRGAALNRIGRTYRQSGDLRQAQQALELALSEFQHAGDARGIAATKDDLGNVLWLLGDQDRALPLLRAAYDERRSVGDERSIAVSLANLALVWHEQGRSDRCEQALGIANDLFGRSDDLGGRCDTLTALGRVAFQRHDARRALRLFQEAAELAYRAKDRPRLARGLVQLGVAQLRQDDLAGAEALLTRARDLAIGIESWLDLAEAERALAKVALKRGLVREARQHASTALRLARRVRSRSQLSATLRTFARVAAEAPHSSSCDHRIVGYFMRAIELAKQTGNDLELAKGYRAFATYTARYEDPEIKRQTDVLRDLSDEIFERYDSQPAASRLGSRAALA